MVADEHHDESLATLEVAQAYLLPVYIWQTKIRGRGAQRQHGASSFDHYALHSAGNKGQMF
jgi:hypothetical protein